MKKTETRYFCDVCKKEVRQAEIHDIKYPVIFHTEQTEGRSVEPYISHEQIEVCKECISKICLLQGQGAQGHNDYWIGGSNLPTQPRKAVSEMTDNEIIKGLESCGNGTTCKQCPYFTTSAKCVNDLCKDALDLINRQKAEIEKLTVNMNAFALAALREKEKSDNATAAAITEYAKWLKQELSFGKYIQPNQIDNLVRKMTGGADNA